MTPTGTFTFQGPAGALEAIYREGKTDSTRVAIVCHPHPQHGGTMHNKVVYRAAKAFESAGYPTLRFNYRGVGRSEGLFDDGFGEADDVQAAINWLVTNRPGPDVVLCGFSFGAVVGLPIGAGDDRVTHLVGLGTPTGRFPFDRLSDVTKPKLFIQGDNDEYGAVDSLRDKLKTVGQPWELVVIEGADHFFTHRLDELEQAIASRFTRSS
ncbi:MAG: alpha/beta hydrolase [Gemmatimonadetes bacterium]|nr:alpha/beta hydrolase [Gemmatimonadota bacterium]